MNFVQTAELLARIQLVDNRRVDEEVIREWQMYLADVDDFEAAMEAVTLHRMSSRQWLMPVDVVEGIARIRNADPAPVDEFDNPVPRDELALAARERLGRGREVTS
ncbi:hypothetical protein [Microbacterium sp.]|uniref:hypothetical protein n=1 Tax=Microbacterium sp. TaxID=51671 RepID=UPI0039E29350